MLTSQSLVNQVNRIWDFILLSLQTSISSWYYFMGSGRRQETPGSETKLKAQLAAGDHHVLCLCPRVCVLTFICSFTLPLGLNGRYSGFVSQLRNTDWAWGTHYLIAGSQPPEGDATVSLRLFATQPYGMAQVEWSGPCILNIPSKVCRNTRDSWGKQRVVYFLLIERYFTGFQF